MRMCIREWICVCVYIYAYVICMWMYTCRCVVVCVCVCTWICDTFANMDVYVCTHMCMYMHVCISQKKNRVEIQFVSLEMICMCQINHVSWRTATHNLSHTAFTHVGLPQQWGSSKLFWGSSEFWLVCQMRFIGFFSITKIVVDQKPRKQRNLQKSQNVGQMKTIIMVLFVTHSYVGQDSFICLTRAWLIYLLTTTPLYGDTWLIHISGAG